METRRSDRALLVAGLRQQASVVAEGAGLVERLHVGTDVKPGRFISENVTTQVLLKSAK